MKVTEKLETLSFYDLEGSLDSVIKTLKDLKVRYPGKDLRLDLRSSEYDDSKVLAVVWDRPENEEEAKKRELEAAASKEYRRQQYDRLKKEFEA